MKGPVPATRPCPVCARESHRPYLKKGAQVLVQCTNCEAVYASPLPQEVAQGTYYTAQGGYYLSSNKLQSDFSPVRFQRETRLFQRFCPQGAVLDVGCSTGGFLQHLNACFPGRYQTWGIDVSRPAVAHARGLGLSVQCGGFAEAKLSRSTFDAITFWAVMEHLVAPAVYLRRAAALLSPGGWCFILVPNLRSLAVRLLGKRYRYFMEEHINWFSAATLRRLIALEPSLTARHLTTTHFNPLVIAQDARRARDHVPAEERAALLKRTTAWKQHPLLLPVRLAYRLSERCLAQFNLADNLVLVAQRS